MLVLRVVRLSVLADRCGARQYDYTKGQLPDLIDVIIEEKAKLFVCAVGVPPKWAVDKLHAAGIPVMNVSTPQPLCLFRFSPLPPFCSQRTSDT